MKHPIFLVRVPKVLLKTVIQGDKTKRSSKNLPKKSMHANKNFFEYCNFEKKSLCRKNNIIIHLSENLQHQSQRRNLA